MNTRLLGPELYRSCCSENDNGRINKACSSVSS